MANEQNNVHRKYKVLSFRGWMYAPTYPAAIKAAYRMARDMREQFPKNPELWWARIDYSYCVGRSRAIVVAGKNGQCALHLMDSRGNSIF